MKTTTLTGRTSDTARGGHIEFRPDNVKDLQHFRNANGIISGSDRTMKIPVSAIPKGYKQGQKMAIELGVDDRQMTGSDGEVIPFSRVKHGEISLIPD